MFVPYKRVYGQGIEDLIARTAPARAAAAAFLAAKADRPLVIGAAHERMSNSEECSSELSRPRLARHGTNGSPKDPVDTKRRRPCD